MDEEFDRALQVDVLANMLRLEQKQSADLVEFIAKMLQSSLPERTKITRGGWLLSKSRPLEELTVQFDEFGYQINKSKHGTVTARQLKIVRGVALKSTEIQMEQCINEIVRELTQLAEKNAEARMALNKFVAGG